MKSIKKKELLESLANRVESHLDVAINTFQNLTTSKLLEPAANGGWSIAQCLEHLNRYGNYYLPQINRAIKVGKVSADRKLNTFTSGWLGNYFTGTMLPSTGKKKYNAFKEYQPGRELDAHAVVAAFIHQQELMLQYLREASESDLTRRIPISISKIIRLKLGDVFQFVIAHLDRHILQAGRNL